MDWRKITYDAVIVGSGATGSMAARCLTRGGANVLVLEAGPEAAPELQQGEERDPQEFEAIRKRQPVQSQSLLYNKKNCHLFIDDIDNPYTIDRSTEFNWIRARQTGGRTRIWSRFALRMSEQDFHPREYGGAWPISYGELAPYYDRVEALIGVAGTPEGVSSLPDGVFLPRTVPSYVRRLGEKLTKRFPRRHLIPSREAIGREIGLTSLPTCGSPQSSVPALPHPGRLTFRRNCIAARIDLDRPDHARRVIFVDRESHRWSEVEGRVVLLCASTIESVRLLLASTSRHFPTGLANSSGTLGRYLMDHFGGPRIVAVGKIHESEPFSRERAYIPQFCNLSEQSSEFKGGYGIQADFETNGRASSLVTMGVFGEVLPHLDNAIELDHRIRDAWGLVVPKIRFEYRDNERKMAFHALAALREVVEALGFRPMIAHDKLLVGGTRAHELGGARMGSSPANSVLNRFNQCWDVDNLFVTDGSCFPTAGYKGPTLTMMALTARACDRVLRILRAGAV